jgi:hypothetical protein
MLDLGAIDLAGPAALEVRTRLVAPNAANSSMASSAMGRRVDMNSFTPAFQNSGSISRDALASSPTSRASRFSSPASRAGPSGYAARSVLSYPRRALLAVLDRTTRLTALCAGPWGEAGSAG